MTCCARPSPGLVYLASPYSHPDEHVREQRFDIACEMTAILMRLGVRVFSPIVHSHPLVDYGLPNTWDYWQEFDRDFLERCNELWVLTLAGWEESRGVQAEIKIAEELEMPIRFVVVE